MTAFFCINVWLIPSPDGDIGFNPCTLEHLPWLASYGNLRCGFLLVEKIACFCFAKAHEPSTDAARCGFTQMNQNTLVSVFTMSILS